MNRCGERAISTPRSSPAHGYTAPKISPQVFEIARARDPASAKASANSLATGEGSEPSARSDPAASSTARSR